MIFLGTLLLVSDVWQDLAFLQSPASSPALIVSAVTRNLVMVVALVILFLGKGRWGPPLLLMAAGLGLVRRVQFVWPWLGTAQALDSIILGMHSGADLAFRILLVAVAVQLLREARQ